MIWPRKIEYSNGGFSVFCSEACARDTGLRDELIDDTEFYEVEFGYSRCGYCGVDLATGDQPSWTQGDLDILKDLYGCQPLSADNLPYTAYFEQIVAAFNRERGTKRSRWAILHAIYNLRKRGYLPRKGA